MTEPSTHVGTDAVAAVVAALHRYTEAIDTKNWDLLRDCFTADCVATYRTKVLDGVDAVVDFMGPSHDPLDGSLHRLTNITVDIDDDDPHRASASSYVDVLLVRRLHPDGPTFHSIGTYTDTLRFDGRWRLATRTYTQLWVEGSRTILGPTHL